MNRVVASALIAAGALTLAGCGFTPLYGDPAVTAQLHSVQVTTPPGRTGQLIREHLDDALANAKGQPPKYRMDLALSETRYPRGLRVDNVATRYEYVLTASYTVATPVGQTASVVADVPKRRTLGENTLSASTMKMAKATRPARNCLRVMPPERRGLKPW